MSNGRRDWHRELFTNVLREYIQSHPDTGAGQGREYQHEVEPHGLQRRLGQAKTSRVSAQLRDRDNNDMYEGMNGELTLQNKESMSRT